MMTKALYIILLILLFFAISKSADLIVLNLRKLGEKLGVKIFLLGMILGIMTSLPEMSIGINSSINDIPEMSFGNTAGATIVLLALILPISIILNRSIKTDKRPYTFIGVLFLLFLPTLLGLKGSLGFIDGLILIIAYASVLYFLYRRHKSANISKIRIINRKEVGRYLILIIFGMLGLIVSSNLIVKTTIALLKDYNISAFIIGLLVYSIGTNLPELIITIRSYKRRMEDLSFSNIIGSAMGNSLTIGVLSLAQTINVKIDASYLFLTAFSFIFFIVFFIFYKTDKLLLRQEGIFLLIMYFFFLGGQIFIQLNNI